MLASLPRSRKNLYDSNNNRAVPRLAKCLDIMLYDKSLPRYEDNFPVTYLLAKLTLSFSTLANINNDRHPPRYLNPSYTPPPGMITSSLGARKYLRASLTSPLTRPPKLPCKICIKSVHSGSIRLVLQGYLKITQDITHLADPDKRPDRSSFNSSTHGSASFTLGLESTAAINENVFTIANSR